MCQLTNGLEEATTVTSASPPGSLWHTSTWPSSTSNQKKRLPGRSSGKSNATTVRRSGNRSATIWNRAQAHSAKPGSSCSSVTSSQRMAHAPSESMTEARSRPASVNTYVDPRPVCFVLRSMIPWFSSCPSRVTSMDREMVGTPPAISVNVVAPHSMFLTMSGDHRSAMISDARATGQYWRYRLMVPVIAADRPRWLVAQVLFSNYRCGASAATIGS